MDPLASHENLESTTPPSVVEHSDNPQRALAAFIGQELEHWGFHVHQLNSAEEGVLVKAGERTLYVVIV